MFPSFSHMGVLSSFEYHSYSSRPRSTTQSFSLFGRQKSRLSLQRRNLKALIVFLENETNEESGEKGEPKRFLHSKSRHNNSMLTLNHIGDDEEDENFLMGFLCMRIFLLVK